MQAYDQVHDSIYTKGGQLILVLHEWRGKLHSTLRKTFSVIAAVEGGGNSAGKTHRHRRGRKRYGLHLRADKCLNRNITYHPSVSFTAQQDGYACRDEYACRRHQSFRITFRSVRSISVAHAGNMIETTSRAFRPMCLFIGDARLPRRLRSKMCS